MAKLELMTYKGRHVTGLYLEKKKQGNVELVLVPAFKIEPMPEKG